VRHERLLLLAPLLLFAPRMQRQQLASGGAVRHYACSSASPSAACRCARLRCERCWYMRVDVRVGTVRTTNSKRSTPPRERTQKKMLHRFKACIAVANA
jgi:hypothetical protein